MGAVPYYINAGAFTSGSGAISVPIPTGAGYSDGHLLILLVATANQAVATPDGWTEVANSPQGTGPAGSAGGVMLAVFFQIVSGTPVAAEISDSGSVTIGQMLHISGTDPTNPINITAGSVNATASVDWSCPAVTTTVSNCLILNCIAQDRDANSTTSLTYSWNTNLTSFTKRIDQTVSTGAGGGLGLCTGEKAAPGDIGTTFITSAVSTTAAFITIALQSQTVFGVSQSETAAASESVVGSSSEQVTADQADSAALGESSTGVAPIDAAQTDSAAATDEYLPYRRVTVVGVVSLPAKDNTFADHTGSYTVTVPENADFCVLFHGSRDTYIDYTPPYIDDFLTGTYSLGGQTLTLFARSEEFDELVGDNEYICDVAAYKLVGPPTGEQSLLWDFDYTLSDFHYFSLVFYSNVNQTDPLVYQEDRPVDQHYFNAWATGSATPVTRTLDITAGEGGLVVGAVSTTGTTATIETGNQELRLTHGTGEYPYYVVTMVGDYTAGAASSFTFTNIQRAGFLAFALRPSTGELHRVFQAETAGVADASIGQDQTQYVYSVAAEETLLNAIEGAVSAESVEQADSVSASVDPDGELIPSGAEITETAQATDEEDSFATNEGFDRGVGAWATPSEAAVSNAEKPGEAIETAPVRNINGPYVDIPTRMMFSDSRDYQEHVQINSAAGSRSVTIHPDTNLLIFTYSTLFSTPSWIQEGNYTLTMGGVAIAHLANTNAVGYNVMVAYVKNPTSGTIAWNFPNPNFGGAADIYDIIKICQFTNVDVSGSPFRSVIDPITDGYVESLTLSDISFNEGDMVVGIEYGPGGGIFGQVSYNVGKQPNIITGGVYNTSYGWSIRTTVGVVPWGASSITATAGEGGSGGIEDDISMMAVVLKVKLEGWIASPASIEAGSITPADVPTSEQIDAAVRAESLAVEEVPAGVLSITEEGDRTDNTEVTAVETGTQFFGGSGEAFLTVENAQSSERTAYGMGYAWAIARTTQNGWKVADCLRSDAFTVEEVSAAGQGTPADMLDALTVADVVTAYAEAGALMVELIDIAEASDVTQVLGGSISEVMQITAQATTTAEMYAAAVESVILIDQWLAEALRREIKKFMAGARVTSFLYRLVDLSQFMVDKKMLEFACVPAAKEILEQERVTDYAPDQPRSETFTAEKVSVSFQRPKNVQFTAELVQVIFYCAEVKASGETPTKKDFEV